MPDEDVDVSIKMLDTISKNLIAVPETMAIHQVVSTPNAEIINFRKLSGFVFILGSLAHGRST